VHLKLDIVAVRRAPCAVAVTFTFLIAFRARADSLALS
jgi:hypothetical protein